MFPSTWQQFYFISYLDPLKANFGPLTRCHLQRRDFNHYAFTISNQRFPCLLMRLGPKAQSSTSVVFELGALWIRVVHILLCFFLQIHCTILPLYYYSLSTVLLFLPLLMVIEHRNYWSKGEVRQRCNMGGNGVRVFRRSVRF